MKDYPYYIAGEFKKSKERLTAINPSNEEEFAFFYETTFEDLELTLAKAKEAQRIWQQISFLERAKVLRQINQVILENISSLAELETKEIGKPLKESLFVDIPLGADCFNYYAGLLETISSEKYETQSGIDIIEFEPFGLNAVFLPYNVPLMIFGFSCASSLAAGNALIIKPSELGSLSILELCNYLDKIDLPKGLINVVTGKGQTLGRALAKSKVDLISFTGGLNTLKSIIQDSCLYPKKIICELGGCNLAVVFSDADFKKAIENTFSSCFIKSGQMCIGTSLILIEEEIYPRFMAQFLEKIKDLKVGDSFSPQTNLGPLISKRHLEEIDKKVKELIAKGAKVLVGGTSLKQKGYFYAPTVLELNEVIYEELFAPVVLVKSFKRNQISKILEDNPAMLVLQLWTKDLVFAQELAKKASCGTVWINTFAQMSSQTPFGGKGLSGWGRNLGKAGFLEYCQTKHIGIGLKPTPTEGWF